MTVRDHDFMSCHVEVAAVVAGDMLPINGIAYTCSKHEQDHECYCTVNIHSRQYPVHILDMCFRLVHKVGSVKLYTV